MKRVVLLVLATSLLGAACNDGETTNGMTTTTSIPASTSSTSTTAPPDVGGLVVYALAEAVGDPEPCLIPVARQETPATGPAAAVDMLLLGLTFTETGHGLSTQIPAGIQVRSVTMDTTGIVTVDLPAAFEAGGGTSAMLGRLGQLVATVMQFPDVTGVRLAIEGTVVDVFSGEGIVLDDPLTLASIADLRAPVEVTSPAWGAEVVVPFEVVGDAPDADVVGWALVDWDGRIVSEASTAVEEGRFGFQVAPPAEVIDPEASPYQHTLIVWEDIDGAQSHMMEYVLTLRLPG